MIPPSALFLKDSLPYIVAVSVWANLYAAVASWQAAKGEDELVKKVEQILKQTK